MSNQISDGFAGMNLDWGGLKLPVQSLCGGALITGSTGSGKTISVVNPLALKLAALNADDKQMKPAIVYFVTKGSSHESFLEQLPPSRRKDVIRIDGRPGCKFGLSLFPEENWSSLEQLELAVPGFLEEFAEHCWDALSAIRHDPFWDRQRMRVLSELSALRDADSDLFDGSKDHLNTLLERLDAFVEHMETQRPDSDNAELKRWFETAGIIGKRELERAKQVAIRTMMESPNESTVRRLLLMLSKMAEQCSVPSKEPEPETPLQRAYLKLDAPSQARLTRLTVDYNQLARDTRSCVLADLQSLVQLLRTGPAANVFSPARPRILSLEEVIHEGKILVLDLPLSDSSNATRPVLLAAKLALMNRILGRNSALYHGKPLNRTRPVVLIIDEFQGLVSKGRTGGEDQFISRCREFGAIAIYATQSLSLLAGTVRDPAKLEALLANLRTRIFGHSTDRWTCEQAAALCGTSAGRELQLAQVWHGSERLKALVTVTMPAGVPRVLPSTLSTLKTGQFVVATADGNCHVLDASGEKIENPEVRQIT